MLLVATGLGAEVQRPLMAVVVGGLFTAFDARRAAGALQCANGAS